MEILRGSTVLIAVLVVSWNSKEFHCIEFRLSDIDVMTVALYKNVKFMYDRPKQINVDAIFGLNLVEAHTSALLEHENAVLLSENNRRLIREVSKLARTVRGGGKKNISSTAFGGMIRPEIWNHTISWQRNSLGRRPKVSRGITRAKAQLAMYQGTPQEGESDRCIRELIRSGELFKCTVSKKCEEMLIRNDSPRGYPLTHRLLYVQAAIALGCRRRSEINFSKLKRSYCAAILQDLINIEATNFPPPSTDLAMEQIALCGMEGYLEFVNSHYANLIVSWPNSHGCYSGFGFKGAMKGLEGRLRRSSDIMDYGCDNHACGVAAASVSLLIRAAVENYSH